MKERLLLFTMLLLLFSCNKEPINNFHGGDSPKTPLEKSAINKAIYSSLEKTGEFKWGENDVHLAWSALVNSDSVLAIGYQPKGFVNIEERLGHIDINDSEWVNAKNEIITFIVEVLNAEKASGNVKVPDFLVYEEDRFLPIFYIKTSSENLLEKLRAHELVRYAEPLGYDMDEEGGLRSSSGCGSNNPDWSLSYPADYTYAALGGKISWHLDESFVPQAWAHSTGDNIGVCLIDTGTSPNQSKLNSNFTEGLSNNRYIVRLGTYVDSWWWWADPDGPDDDCGHGTSMAGIIAAPNGYYSSVGVAYKANLIAIRATSDVFLSNSREKNGVKDALVIAGNRSDVKIISMSIGTPFWSSTVADGVYYAYNRGKLIFAAAGTSTTWTTWAGVIFPARMWQCTAVTGIKDNGYNHCSTCHYGDEVEFSIIMEKAGNGRKALTLAMSGNQPSTVGGSSAATATTAGIAALVWAKHPTYSRWQIKQRMINAAELHNNPDDDYGYGRINAKKAVLGQYW